MLPKEQFIEMAEKYMDMIFRIAFHYVKNRPEADDITQEVLLKLYNTKKDFENEDHIRHWLMRVTVNCCKKTFLSPWRKTSRFEKSTQSEKTSSSLARDSGPGSRGSVLGWGALASCLDIKTPSFRLSVPKEGAIYALDFSCLFFQVML